MKLLLLIMDIPLLCFGRKMSDGEQLQIVNSLEAGDVVLAADRLFPLWQLFAKLVSGSNYYHSGIYVGGGQIIEATTYYPEGSGVRRTNVYNFVSGYKTCCVVRPPYASPAERNKVLNFAAAQLGKPYDYAMKSEENGAYYCTKLVAESLKTANIFVKTKTFFGKKAFSPDDFIKIQNAKIIYGKNENVLFAVLLQI
ncbi:MAG: hypothetical protein LBN95_05080, partial [Prevotellaceae bacterium]|nr:hypothetical protein [Prevotellaceae bacterium]